MAAARYLPRSVMEWPSLFAFVWMGALFYILSILLLGDLIWGLGELTFFIKKRVSKTPSPTESPLVSRRLFIKRGLGITAAGSASLACGSGILAVNGDFHIPHVPVVLPKLPLHFQGFKIALLSDIHIGYFLDREFMEKTVKQVNLLKPDMIAIVGDMVDGKVSMLKDDVAPLQELEAPFGSYFVSGNHEFYSGIEEWLSEVDRLGIKVLHNELITLGDAEKGVLEIAGVHDYRAGSMIASYAPSFEEIIKSHKKENELIMLAHQPSHIYEADAAGASLQLSGHTHGGQIWPFGYLVSIVQPYVKGLHRHSTNTQIYVTKGTGFWGPPMRIGAPPEISLIELKRS